MTPDELRAEIARWENVHTDFKRKIDRLPDLGKDIVSFANADGGRLIVGVGEDRSIVGVPDVDRLLLQVDDVAFNGCVPPVTVVPETVEMDGVTVVVLRIPRGDQRPYATREGRYYVRSGARSRAASREELLRLFQSAHALFYDEQSMSRLDLGDLDLGALGRYARQTGLEDQEEDLTRLLRAWRLYDGAHPTVSGVLLFGRRPQDYLESAKVVVATFEGTDPGGDLVDRKDLTGDLFAVIDQVQAFLGLHLRTAHTIVGFEPEKQEEIPTGALREAVVNALVHRDYTIPAPTRVFVFSDRVEVHSPGRPPNSVDVDAMRAGVHVPRNPHLYSRVADAQLATRAGTGIRRMARLMRERAQEVGITVNLAEVVISLPRRA